jgi:hypothetical protein
MRWVVSCWDIVGYRRDLVVSLRGQIVTVQPPGLSARLDLAAVDELINCLIEARQTALGPFTPLNPDP